MKRAGKISWQCAKETPILPLYNMFVAGGSAPALLVSIYHPHHDTAPQHVSKLDDPFLSPSCIPAAVANAHEHLYVEVCEYGGHVGFINSLNFSSVWSEERTIRFLEEQDKIATIPSRTKN
jgi:hypothetical protein